MISKLYSLLFVNIVICVHHTLSATIQCTVNCGQSGSSPGASLSPGGGAPVTALVIGAPAGALQSRTPSSKAQTPNIAVNPLPTKPKGRPYAPLPPHILACMEGKGQNCGRFGRLTTDANRRRFLNNGRKRLGKSKSRGIHRKSSSRSSSRQSQSSKDAFESTQFSKSSMVSSNQLKGGASKSISDNVNSIVESLVSKLDNNASNVRTVSVTDAAGAPRPSKKAKKKSSSRRRPSKQGTFSAQKFIVRSFQTGKDKPDTPDRDRFELQSVDKPDSIFDESFKKSHSFSTKSNVKSGKSSRNTGNKSGFFEGIGRLGSSVGSAVGNALQGLSTKSVSDSLNSIVDSLVTTFDKSTSKSNTGRSSKGSSSSKVSTSSTLDNLNFGLNQALSNQQSVSSKKQARKMASVPGVVSSTTAKQMLIGIGKSSGKTKSSGIRKSSVLRTSGGTRKTQGMAKTSAERIAASKQAANMISNVQVSRTNRIRGMDKVSGRRKTSSGIGMTRQTQTMRNLAGIGSKSSGGQTSGMEMSSGIGMAKMSGIGKTSVMGTSSGSGMTQQTRATSVLAGMGKMSGLGRSSVTGTSSGSRMTQQSQATTYLGRMGDMSGVGKTSAVGTSSSGIGMTQQTQATSIGGMGNMSGVGKTSATGTSSGIGMTQQTQATSIGGMGDMTGVGKTSSIGTSSGIGMTQQTQATSVSGMGNMSGVGKTSGAGTSSGIGMTPERGMTTGTGITSGKNPSLPNTISTSHMNAGKSSGTFSSFDKHNDDELRVGNLKIELEYETKTNDKSTQDASQRNNLDQNNLQVELSKMSRKANYSATDKGNDEDGSRGLNQDREKQDKQIIGITSVNYNSAANTQTTGVSSYGNTQSDQQLNTNIQNNRQASTITRTGTNAQSGQQVNTNIQNARQQNSILNTGTNLQSGRQVNRNAWQQSTKLTTGANAQAGRQINIENQYATQLDMNMMNNPETIIKPMQSAALSELMTSVPRVQNLRKRTRPAVKRIGTRHVESLIQKIAGPSKSRQPSTTSNNKATQFVLDNSPLVSSQIGASQSCNCAQGPAQVPSPQIIQATAKLAVVGDRNCLIAKIPKARVVDTNGKGFFHLEFANLIIQPTLTETISSPSELFGMNMGTTTGSSDDSEILVVAMLPKGSSLGYAMFKTPPNIAPSVGKTDVPKSPFLASRTVLSSVKVKDDKVSKGGIDVRDKKKGKDSTAKPKVSVETSKDDGKLKIKLTTDKLKDSTISLIKESLKQIKTDDRINIDTSKDDGKLKIKIKADTSKDFATTDVKQKIQTSTDQNSAGNTINRRVDPAITLSHVNTASQIGLNVADFAGAVAPGSARPAVPQSKPEPLSPIYTQSQIASNWVAAAPAPAILQSKPKLLSPVKTQAQIASSSADWTSVAAPGPVIPQSIPLSPVNAQPQILLDSPDMRSVVAPDSVGPAITQTKPQSLSPINTQPQITLYSTDLTRVVAPIKQDTIDLPIKSVRTMTGTNVNQATQEAQFKVEKSKDDGKIKYEIKSKSGRGDSKSNTELKITIDNSKGGSPPEIKLNVEKGDNTVFGIKTSSATNNVLTDKYTATKSRKVSRKMEEDGDQRQATFTQNMRKSVQFGGGGSTGVTKSAQVLKSSNNKKIAQAIKALKAFQDSQTVRQSTKTLRQGKPTLPDTRYKMPSDGGSLNVLSDKLTKHIQNVADVSYKVKGQRSFDNDEAKAKRLISSVHKLSVKTPAISSTVTSGKKKTPNLEALCLIYLGAFIDSIGYAPYPGKCHKLVQCFYLGGKLRAIVRDCPAGMFWDQTMLLCRPPDDVLCFEDRCLVPGIRHYQRNGQCNSFYKCLDGISVPSCCPTGYRYDDNNECVPAGRGVCNDQCETPRILTRQLEQTSCPSLPDPMNKYGYLSPQFGGLRIRACPAGTLYSELQCRCKTNGNVGSLRKQYRQCSAEFKVNFDDGFRDISRGGLAFDHSHINLRKGKALFRGKGKMHIWGFASRYLGKTFAIKFRVKVNRGAGRYKPEAIISNCGPNGDSSIEVVVHRGKMIFKAKTTENPDILYFNEDYDEDKWIDVSYFYDGDYFGGSCNGRTFRKRSGGNLESRANPMAIGRCTGQNGFHGEIDELEIYTACIPK